MNARLAITTLLAALAATAALVACAKQDAPAAAPRTRAVAVTPVANAPLGQVVSAVGLLTTKDEARLAFKVGGVVESIRVEEGAAVRQGQVLASLRQAEVGSATEQAREAADKAQRDLARAKALYADGVATEEQVQDLTTAYSVARAALRSAEFNLQYARIVAPGDGVVLRKLVQANELVQPGQPVLMVGGLGRGWIVKTSLADRDVVHVAVGDPVRVSFDAWPGRPFKGRVTNVSSAADVATGTFPIEVQVEAGDARFVQGLVAKLALTPASAQVKSAPVVPLQSLLEANGDQAYVFVLDPAKRTVKRVAVRTGRLAGDRVEILDGLRLGEQVVSEGAAFLNDGESVRVADAQLAAAR